MFRLICLAWLMTYSKIYGNVCSGHYEISFICDASYGKILTTLKNIRTITECTAMCSSNNQCLSIKADVVKKECHLNSERYLPMNTHCPTKVEYAMLTQNSCSGISLCVEGKCQCDPGYSYNHNNESYLTSCDVYGSTFTLHPDHKIRSNNEKKVHNVSSSQECARACANETSFVCLTVDYRYYDRQCVLSTETALTRPFHYNQHTGYDHYQRNCQ